MFFTMSPLSLGESSATRKSLFFVSGSRAIQPPPSFLGERRSHCNLGEKEILTNQKRNTDGRVFKSNH